MSVVQNPLIGRASGKFSNAIFQKWKNLNIIRSKPLTVANPQSPAQTMRRGMFSTAVDVARDIAPIITIGFNGFKATLTWMNVFINRSFLGFITPGIAPLFTVDTSLLIISDGPMTPTAISTIVAVDASADVTVTWDPATVAADQAATDLPMLVVVNGVQNVFIYRIGDAAVQRSGGSVLVSLPVPNATGDDVYAFLFFQRLDGSMVGSNTNSSVVVA